MKSDLDDYTLRFINKRKQITPSPVYLIGYLVLLGFAAFISLQFFI